MNRKILPVAVAALLVATVAAYLPSMDGEFQYDDQEIAKTTWVRDASRFLAPGTWWEMSRPLTAASFAADHAIDGFRPTVWHVTNVLVHLAAVLLAWRFARRILARAGLSGGAAAAAGGRDESGNGRAKRKSVPVALSVPEWPALAAAALFALHPLQTEAVSYISQRSEAFASALYLGGLLALLAWDVAEPARRSKLLAAAIGLHILGLGAKPIAATMPFAWLLLAATLPLPQERELPWFRRVARRLPAALPLVALSIFAATSGVAGVRGSGHAGYDLGFVTPLGYVATQLRALPTYVRLVFWPAGLCADWFFPYSRSFLEVGVLGGLALVAALVAAALIALRRFGRAEGDGPAAARLAAFGWFFFLGVLVPTMLVPLRDPFVEHRLYLASFALALPLVAAATVALRRLWPSRARVAGAVVAVAVIASLGAATAIRNEVWKSALNLWADASQKAPQKPRIWVNLGTALHFAGRFDEAVKAYDRALALGYDPTVPLELVVRNTALALVRLRRYDEARDRLVRYLRGAPRDAGTIVILALVEIDTNRLDDAKRSAREALALDARMSRPYQILGQVQERRGDLQGAYDHYLAAWRIDPADPLPVYSMGRVEETRGRIAEACTNYARATDALARSSAGRSAAEAYRRLCAGRAER